MNLFGTDYQSFTKATLVPVILSLLVFYSCFVGNSSLTILATLLVCAHIATSKIKDVLPYMLYYTSFAYMFLAGDFMLYEFLGITFMVKCFISGAVNKKTIILWVPIYFITHLMSSSLTLGNIIPVINVFILLFACLSYSEDNYEQCVFLFILGVLITSLLGFLKPLSPHLSEMFEENFAGSSSIDFLIRYSGLSYDPNFFTLISIVAIIVLLLNKKKNSWITMIVAAVIIYCGFLTYSKSFILSLAAIVILLVLDKNNKNTFKIGALALLGFVFFASTFEGIYKVLVDRFSSASNFSELSTGRDELWIYYINHIGENISTLFMGHGFTKLANFKAAHNTFLEVLFNFGLIGFFVDICFITKCFRSVARSCKGLVSICIALLLALLLFNLSAYTYPSLWACIFMTFILISHRYSYSHNC